MPADEVDAAISHTHNALLRSVCVRLTGSTTAAIINLLHIITNMLLSNPYIVISLDVSKAFDMVRHSALLDRLNQLIIPDTVYNYMVDVLSDCSHVDRRHRRSPLRQA